MFLVLLLPFSTEVMVLLILHRLNDILSIFETFLNSTALGIGCTLSKKEEICSYTLQAFQIELPFEFLFLREDFRCLFPIISSFVSAPILSVLEHL